MQTKTLLIGALVFQLLIVAGMLVTAAIPLWSGRDVYVEVYAVDPRDLMRGSYVRLDYPWNSISLAGVSTDIKADAQLRHGLPVFVVVDETSPKCNVVGVYLAEPAEGTFIKGLVQNPMSWRNGETTVELKFGIESYFTNEEDALAIENDLRADSTITVHLKVSPGGNSRIASLTRGTAD